MTTSNIQVVQNYLAAAQSQDFEAMRAVFTDDMIYRVPGRSPLSGITDGPSAAIDYFGAIMGLTLGTYAIDEIVDWLASETRVALVAKERASRNGHDVKWTRIVLFTFRDGKICEVSLFDDDLYALDAVLTS
jgi:ketosteroid isomerase-like protein